MDTHNFQLVMFLMLNWLILWFQVFPHHMQGGNNYRLVEMDGILQI